MGSGFWVLLLTGTWISAATTLLVVAPGRSLVRVSVSSGSSSFAESPTHSCGDSVRRAVSRHSCCPYLWNSCCYRYRVFIHILRFIPCYFHCAVTPNVGRPSMRSPLSHSAVMMCCTGLAANAVSALALGSLEGALRLPLPRLCHSHFEWPFPLPLWACCL
jgi:hypothetical protein